MRREAQYKTPMCIFAYSAFFVSAPAGWKLGEAYGVNAKSAKVAK